MRRLVSPVRTSLLLATHGAGGPGVGPARTHRWPAHGGLGMGGPMEHDLFPPELILMNQMAHPAEHGAGRRDQETGRRHAQPACSTPRSICIA